MAFLYRLPGSTALRQGEIVTNWYELALEPPDPRKATLEPSVDFLLVLHPHLIIVSQDCDLDWDFKARGDGAAKHKMLDHVMVCDLFTDEEFKRRTEGQTRMYRDAKSGQNQRFHFFDQAPVADTGDRIPDLFADFKLVFSVPIELAYWLARNKNCSRRGILPSPFLEQFMQRLGSFWGRVATE